VLQLAALCYRIGQKGREVLLVTSSNGRWILPKGWPIDGLKARDAALQEAWEEGGVRKGKVAKKPLGSFLGIKRYDNGTEVACKTKVFEVKVRDLAKDYPEAEQRDRMWVTPKKAAKLVDEAGLKEILTGY
jgi:8-oxo-dGTP pyrophosphatase MutT (NUDIX family)